MKGLEDLREILSAKHEADEAIMRLHVAVAEARCRNRTWSEIAVVMGLTAQAVAERFGGR